MKITAFDIETGAAEDLHSYGPGFIRLCGWADVAEQRVQVSTDPAEMVRALRAADAITAHNGVNFDLMALARHGFISFDEYEALCLKCFDTMIVERHLNPVVAKNRQPRGYYGLDQTAERYRVTGKSSVDFEGRCDIVRRIKGDAEAARMVKARAVRIQKAQAKAAETNDQTPVQAILDETFPVLKLLADLYGGFDQIPQDDPDYCGYLEQDVLAQAGLFTAQAALINELTPASRRYVRREHFVQSSMGRSVTLEGSRIDMDLTMRRWSEGQARLEAGKALLHEKFGMPTEGKKPHTSNPGKAAFRAAILATLGCTEERLNERWPLAKDGSLKTGKDVLNEFIPLFERNGRQEGADLCRTILAMNGERTVYGTVLDHVTGGRIHPYVGPDQASGRWSLRNPGVTVLGKRGGKAQERAMVLADTDDEVLVAIDADQVDARVVAAECQDPEYMKLFQPGVDLHSEVAFRVWGSPTQHGPDCHMQAKPGCDCGVIRKCHCDKRDFAKVFGHGFSYGLGANGMSMQHGVELSVAQGFIAGMTEAFPRLAEWKAEVRERAGVLGYDETPPSNDTFRVLTTWAGRPVRVERVDAYTQATAMIGQGGTRDVMAEAILRLPADIRRRVRAVIHDEIVLSLPREGAQEAAQAIADGMAFDLKGVRITFGCSRVSRSWAGCYGEQYETAA